MTAIDHLAAALEGHGEVKRDEVLSRHTTFGIGGPADIFVTVRDAAGLAYAVTTAQDAGVGVFVLGSGSNILVADKGIRGVVVDNRARREEADSSGTRYRVESGASFAAFARKMCRQGLDGLAWAVGIPGTLGGAVVYNAGAYGGCLADVLTRVRLQDHRDGDAWIEAAQLGLVYRGSVFTRGQFDGKTVLEAEVQLAPGDAAALLERAASYDAKRLTAQPRGRNAGSTFKNPPESPAWKLIDEVGMRGATRGDAAVSDKHCNFFVNYGNARAEDVAWLVTEAQRRVREQFGIELQREVAFVGDWS
ncbi:MAG: UDP-N-acetylmuramate dehydrogenase [Dehalococcoidia bacterium]|nr:UDP-N-acetylmuramate dehydrogenase [Dehalococcoidia bacterium]